MWVFSYTYIKGLILLIDYHGRYHSTKPRSCKLLTLNARRAAILVAMTQ